MATTSEPHRTPTATKIFGVDGSSRALARRVSEELLDSAAWAAFLGGFGTAERHRFGWVSVDGMPFAPVQFGGDQDAVSGVWSRLDRDTLNESDELALE